MFCQSLHQFLCVTVFISVKDGLVVKHKTVTVENDPGRFTIERAVWCSQQLSEGCFVFAPRAFQTAATETGKQKAGKITAMP